MKNNLLSGFIILVSVESLMSLLRYFVKGSRLFGWNKCLPVTPLSQDWLDSSTSNLY